jgi:phosphatidylglycerol:prolipoprotein diacylglycerol transferase
MFLSIALAVWLHDLSPWVVRFGPSFGVRWYGLAYSGGFVLGWLLLRFLARRRALAIAPERAGDVVFACVLGVVLGGRLGYVIFYQPSLLWLVTSDPPWWGVLQVNKGGMASHGGMIGVILVAWWISRRWCDPAILVESQRAGLATLGQRFRHLLDAMAMAVPPGMFLGRLANFINGELLGDVVVPPAAMGASDRPAPWWSVRFPQEIDDEYLRRIGRIADRPPLLDEARWRDLEQLLSRAGVTHPGERFEETWGRALDRIQHGGRDLARQIEPYLAARHPSQLYQALAEGVVLMILLWAVARRPRRPGIVGCWFMMGYGAMRVLTELWRLPDAQLAVQRFAGLSRGQWLSVAMFAIGLFALAIIRARPGIAVGGWARKTDRPPVSP